VCDVGDLICWKKQQVLKNDDSWCETNVSVIARNLIITRSSAGLPAHGAGSACGKALGAVPRFNCWL